MSVITDLKVFASERNINLINQMKIAEEASINITRKYNFTTEEIKENFDMLLRETEQEAYRVYLSYEKEYGKSVLTEFYNFLIESKMISKLPDLPDVASEYFTVFDKFFLSLAQSRKTRAGKSFEKIHNSLFKILDYKFDEQRVINGKPDFLMPSYKYWQVNPLDCIVFTSKRTLRERWRQIITEGTKGIGFFLATIDDKLTGAQLEEMHKNRIYIVCPESIIREKYRDKVNVISFSRFFKDYLDPAMDRWKRNGVI